MAPPTVARDADVAASSQLRRLSLPGGYAYETGPSLRGVNALISGLITVVPVYLAVLLLLKAMGSVLGLVSPFAKLLPDWLPATNILALLLLLVICFVVGVALRTAAVRAARERLERSLFSRLPGFALLRSLTQQLTGQGQEKVWKPALRDRRRPGPGILDRGARGRARDGIRSLGTHAPGWRGLHHRRERVHILDIPFTQAVSTVSRWGAGSSDLVAAMGTGASLKGSPRGDRIAGAPQPALRS